MILNVEVYDEWTRLTVVDKHGSRRRSDQRHTRHASDVAAFVRDFAKKNGQFRVRVICTPYTEKTDEAFKNILRDRFSSTEVISFHKLEVL